MIRNIRLSNLINVKTTGRIVFSIATQKQAISKNVIRASSINRCISSSVSQRLFSTAASDDMNYFVFARKQDKLLTDFTLALQPSTVKRIKHL